MKDFDVVIIGSGLGGLCCGYILSKEGYNVCILEKNRQLGGSLQIFSRDKAVFDTGIHYIGGLAEGQNLHQYFKYFGLIGKLKLKQLDENGFDRITLYNDKTDYYHAQGYDNFVDRLSEQFPDERQNIQRYIDKIRSICEFFPLYRLSLERKDLSFADFLSLNAKSYIDSITTNQKLRDVLAGSSPLYAGDPVKTPFYVHALVVNTYIESAWRCVGGGSQIAKYIAQGIKENGGTILNYSQASRFNFKGNEIESVELKDGTRIFGKKFISNADISKTLEMIEGSEVRPAYRSRINSLENSISAFIVNVVFKKNSFKYWNYNRYHYGAENVWSGPGYHEKDWPLGLAMFTPLSSKNSEYADSITLMSYMRFDEVKKWEHSHSTVPKNITSRGQEYEDFKHKKAEKMLNMMEAQFPGFKNNVHSYHTSTPLTYRDYIGTRDGTLYGILKDHNDPLKTFISPKTKVPNLFLTGQNLNMHGVLGVTVSSVVTCSEFCDSSYLIKKISAT